MKNKYSTYSAKIKEYYQNNRTEILKKSKIRQQKNKSKIQTYSKEYRAKNKEKIKALKSAYHQRRGKILRNKNKEKTAIRIREKQYGVTHSQFIKMLEDQDHRCAICRLPETVSHHKSKTVRLLAIDHCHKTDKVRGLLCSSCNLGLGNFKDKLDLLWKAADYLLSHRRSK